MSRFDPIPSATPERGAAPPQRIWTGGTWAVLAGGIVLVLLAALTLVFVGRAAATRGDGVAERIAERFIDSAVEGSEEWRELSSAQLISTYLDRSPLRPDEATLETLQMTVDAKRYPIKFTRSTDPDEEVEESQADAAYVVVDLTYDWKYLDTDFTFSVPQQVWLTRPFYYGDDIPDRADPERTPTAIGPWRVTMVSFPQFSVMNPGLGSAPALTDLQTDERDPGAGTCSSVGALFADLSEYSRKDGTMNTLCSLRIDGSYGVGDGVDLELLAAEMPVFNEKFLPDSAFRLRSNIEGEPLLAQYPIETSDGVYIITVGAGSTNGTSIEHGDYQARLLSIVKAEAS